MQHALFLPGELHGALGVRAGNLDAALALGRGVPRLFAAVRWNLVDDDLGFLEEVLDAAATHAPGSRVVFLIQDRTFQPLPDALPQWVHEAGLALTTRDGTVSRRWDPAIAEALRELYEGIHSLFRSHSAFGGTCTSETAPGATDDGYTPALYISALRHRMGFEPHGAERYFTANYLPGPQALLANLCLELSEQNVWCGGPDIRRTDQTLTESVYNIVYPSIARDWRFTVASMPTYHDFPDAAAIEQFAEEVLNLELIVWRYGPKAPMDLLRTLETTEPAPAPNLALAYLEERASVLIAQRDEIEEEIAEIGEAVVQARIRESS